MCYDHNLPILQTFGSTGVAGCGCGLLDMSGKESRKVQTKCGKTKQNFQKKTFRDLLKAQVEQMDLHGQGRRPRNSQCLRSSQGPRKQPLSQPFTFLLYQQYFVFIYCKDRRPHWTPALSGTLALPFCKMCHFISSKTAKTTYKIGFGPVVIFAHY